MTQPTDRAREVLAREMPQADWADLRKRIVEGSTMFHSDPASWVAEAAIRAMLAYAAEQQPTPAAEPLDLAPWVNFHGDLPDYDHPLRCVFESGAEYAVELLAKTLKVEAWEVCDGTEEYDGDLGGTMFNIVLAALPKDEHGDELHPSELPPVISRDALARLTTPTPAADQFAGVGKPIDADRAGIVGRLREVAFEELRRAFFAGRGTCPAKSAYDSEAVEATWNKSVELILAALDMLAQSQPAATDSEVIAYAMRFRDEYDNGYGAETRRWVRALRSALTTPAQSQPGGKEDAPPKADKLWHDAREIAIKFALPGKYDGTASHAVRRGDADNKDYMGALRYALSLATPVQSQPGEVRDMVYLSARIGPILKASPIVDGYPIERLKLADEIAAAIAGAVK